MLQEEETATKSLGFRENPLKTERIENIEQNLYCSVKLGTHQLGSSSVDENIVRYFGECASIQETASPL